MANRIIRRLASSGIRSLPMRGRGTPIPNGPTTTSGRKLPGLGAGFANTIKPKGSSDIAATAAISYSTPGQPRYPDWDASLATRQYLTNVYVMRSVQTIADTIAGLPFVTGLDPDNPAEHGDSPLATLLGPAKPGSVGGPNPTMSARQLWAWSISQYVVTGRWGWESLRDLGTPAYDRNRKGQIYNLWPLVSAALAPIPSNDGAQEWFSGFEYTSGSGTKYRKTPDQVAYFWKGSLRDWREPESVLQSIQLPISIVNGINRYMWSLLKNDMMASKIIVTPPFAESDQRRAWQDQFESEYMGFDNAGKSIFAEASNDYDQQGKLVDQAKVQVIDLAARNDQAQLLEMLREMKIDESIGLGVPISLLGNASQRTYANSDAEYRNFWTMRALSVLSEIQEPINVSLAPQLGPEVGWFDLSRVVALQPPTVFAPPSVKDMLDQGVITVDDVANILNLPSLESTGMDTDTAPVGEEAPHSGGFRSWRPTEQGEGYRAIHHGMRLAENVFVERKPLNTHTLATGVWKVVQRRERAIATSGHRALPPSLVRDTVATVHRIRGYRSEGRGKLIASGVAVKAADTGRVLMLQRALTEKDPASGQWEFPGGHIEPGEDSFDAAQREWQEETGSKLPVGNVAGSWTTPNGVYRGHVVVVPSESDVTINPDKPKVRNPDNPRGKYQETAAWFDPEHLPENPSVRQELLGSTEHWLPVVRAAQTAEGYRYDASPLGEGDNWVTRTGGLHPFIRAVAHALEREGHSESQAIQIAIGRIKDWAAGEGNVRPDTRAKAVEAIAHWEAQKAAAHAS